MPYTEIDCQAFPSRRVVGFSYRHISVEEEDDSNFYCEVSISDLETILDEDITEDRLKIVLDGRKLQVDRIAVKESLSNPNKRFNVYSNPS
jgi:hypothetical protein